MSQPLEKHLRPALSPDRVERVWRRIAQERELARAGETKPRFWWLVMSPATVVSALIAVLAAGGGAWLALRMPTQPALVQTAAVKVMPIALRDGHALSEVSTRESGDVVALNDGSELTIAPETRLVPLELSDRAVVLHLVKGRARFSVKPGGPRRWVIEAGGASVEVVGTKFTVERAHGVVDVNVEEGKVLVRSPSIQDGVAKLTVGQSLRVASPNDVVKNEPVAIADEPEPAAVAEPEILERVGAAEASSASARSSRKDKDAARVSPRPHRAQDGFALGSLDASSLLAMADNARMRHDYREALGALDRVVKEHATDPRAPLAAFTIGRIRDEELLDPERAASAYENALSLGLSGPLAEDCRIRLLRVLETQVKRGSASGSRVVRAAEDYLRRYPKGRYAAEARAKLNAERSGDAITDF